MDDTTAALTALRRGFAIRLDECQKHATPHPFCLYRLRGDVWRNAIAEVDAALAGHRADAEDADEYLPLYNDPDRLRDFREDR